MDITRLEAKLIASASKNSIHRLIVGAVVEREGKVILLKRRPDNFMPGIFELPSGEVNSHETLSQALYREVLEETDLGIVSIDAYLGFFDYRSNSGKPTRQFNFAVSVKDGGILLSEHDAFVWAVPTDLADLAISDSTRNVIETFWKAGNRTPN